MAFSTEYPNVVEIEGERNTYLSKNSDEEVPGSRSEERDVGFINVAHRSSNKKLLNGIVNEIYQEHQTTCSSVSNANLKFSGEESYEVAVDMKSNGNSYIPENQQENSRPKEKLYENFTHYIKNIESTTKRLGSPVEDKIHCEDGGFAKTDDSSYTSLLSYGENRSVLQPIMRDDESYVFHVDVYKPENNRSEHVKLNDDKHLPPPYRRHEFSVSDMISPRISQEGYFTELLPPTSLYSSAQKNTNGSPPNTLLAPINSHNLDKSINETSFDEKCLLNYYGLLQNVLKPFGHFFMLKVRNCYIVIIKMVTTK